MYSSITLVGRISNEINLKYLENTGTPICEFDIAVKRKLKSSVTDFYSIQVWGNYGETMSNILEKGQLVLINGTGKFEKWTDDNSKNQTKFKVETDNIIVLNSSNKNHIFKECIDENNVFKEDDPFDSN